MKILISNIKINHQNLMANGNIFEQVIGSVEYSFTIASCDFMMNGVIEFAGTEYTRHEAEEKIKSLFKE